jgi:hypothetical protein
VEHVYRQLTEGDGNTWHSGMRLGCHGRKTLLDDRCSRSVNRRSRRAYARLAVLPRIVLCGGATNTVVPAVPRRVQCLRARSRGIAPRCPYEPGTTPLGLSARPRHGDTWEDPAEGREGVCSAYRMGMWEDTSLGK